MKPILHSTIRAATPSASSALRRTKLLAFSAFGLLLAVVISILLVGQYAHTAMDDFSYGADTASALRNGRNLIRAVYITAKGYYFHWQGTYSAAALMSLVPSIWNEDLYALTPAIMLLSLFLGTFSLLHTLLHRLLGRSRYEVLAAGSLMLLISVELLPSPKESFFWYNGAIYYTFTYGIFLLFVSCLIRIASRKEGDSASAQTFCAILLAFFLGGNNFVTALLASELCLLFMLYCWLRRRELRTVSTAITAVLLLCFLFSALAPGNAVRQSALPQLSPPNAVLQAILQGLQELTQPSSVAVFLGALLAIPYMGKLADQSSCSFRHPVFVQLLLFLLYASQHAPTFYATSEVGPARLRNIIFFSLLWFMLLSVFYWVGFFRKNTCCLRFPRPLRHGFCIILCLLLAAQLCHIHGVTPFTSSEAVKTLSDGSAAAFDAEMDSRVAQLSDPSVSDPVVPRISSQPDLLFVTELTDREDYWLNQATSKFYGKDSVKVNTIPAS